MMDVYRTFGTFHGAPMTKTAIVLFSDPKAGSEEALGRLFNALFLTYDLKERGQEVALIFQGAGTRWAAELVKADHPECTKSIAEVKVLLNSYQAEYAGNGGPIVQVVTRSTLCQRRPGVEPFGDGSALITSEPMVNCPAGSDSTVLAMPRSRWWYRLRRPRWKQPS